MDVLFDIFAPFNTALRPKCAQPAQIGSRSTKATTSGLAHRSMRRGQYSNDQLSSCASCSDSHAQGMTRCFNVFTRDGVTARNARNLLRLITQTFGG